MAVRLLPTNALICFVTILFNGSTAHANTFSSFPEVVRIEGAKAGMGGTGSLIGSLQNGNQLGLVFLATDHTIQRVGPLTNIGFGDAGSPSANVAYQSSINPMIFSKGPNGTTDVSVVCLTVDLSTISSTEADYLAARVPIAFDLSPTPFSPFEITAYGFGKFGSNVTYGSQATFENVIDSYSSFSGSYTTDQNGSPLYYTEEIESFTYNDPGTGDWVPGEGAGYGGYSGSPYIVHPSGTSTIQGFQVVGSDLMNGAVSFGVQFTPDLVDWIKAQRDGYLLPEPSRAALLATGISLMLSLRRWRQQR